MQNDNLKKSSTLKNWLIRKLLTSEETKEEVLNYIASNQNDKDVNKLEDNNEQSLIKLLLNYMNK